MLKHVQTSPMRNHHHRSDTLSIRSSISSSSSSCASSMCGSPEPEPADSTAAATLSSSSSSMRAGCRASSYTSLSEVQPQATIKIFTACLRIDIEYKTLGIQWNTTSKDVVGQLLRRCKIRQRDPRLFFLCMKISVRRAGVKTLLVLEDDASPAILQACYPKGDTQFYLQMKPGGLVKVQTSVLQPASQYKSVLIAEETTSDELLQLLLRSYKSTEPVERFSVYEVSADQEYQRKLHPDDQPLRAQQQRIQRGEPCQFMVRENPQYLCRSSSAAAAAAFLRDAADIDRLLCVEENAAEEEKLQQPIQPDSVPESVSVSSSPSPAASSSSGPSLCSMCKYSFKTCDFCHKNAHQQLLMPPPPPPQSAVGQRHKTAGYSPVYNIREIRTQRQSFPSPVLQQSAASAERRQLSTGFGRQYALTESGAGGVAI